MSSHGEEEEHGDEAAEIRDKVLFRQPDTSHLGDCPICILPLPLDTDKTMMQSCCTTLICIGCYYASISHEVKHNIQPGKRTCPFCRRPEPKSAADIQDNRLKRIEANDPLALREAGKKCYHDGDYEGGRDKLLKAVENGDVEAHYCLSFLYGDDGKGVDKDEAKEMYHLEEAAIGGHPKARHNLGVYELKHGRVERAVKHFIISANNGHDDSLKALSELRAAGKVGKEEFDMALRAYQDAVDATKSLQREAAEKAMKALNRKRL